MLYKQKGKEKDFSQLVTFNFPLFLFCLFSRLFLSFGIKIIEPKMDTIPENVPTETTLEIGSILAIKETDPISQIQHSACAVPEGDSAKAIAKTITPKDGHVRRNSTGNIGIPYKSVKILSRYLASTTSTSCHDQCKYGIRQDFDTNMLGSRTLKAIAEKHSRGMGKNVALTEGKKKSAVSFPSSGSRSQKRDSPVSAARRELSLSSPKGNLFKQFSLPLKGLVPRSKPTLSKLSTLPTEDHSGSKDISTDVRYVDVLATSSGRKQTIRNDKEEKTFKLNGKKVSSSRANAPSSSLHSVKKVLSRPIVSLAPKHSGKKYIRTRTDKLKSLKVVGKAEIQLSSLNKDKTSKREISIDQLSTTSTEKVAGRTQYKQGTCVAQSSTSQDQVTNMDKRSMNAEAGKSKPKRDGIVRAKDKDSTARRLNFRKGKVIENQPVITPSRRLKFKQRSLSDSLVVEVEKIESNFQNREIRIDDADVNAANSESEKVVLKHQEVDEDKKGPQNLLNNMIEETANKLAETKKSKVKVLVGAFETVISLQDTKPAASMVDAC